MFRDSDSMETQDPCLQTTAETPHERKVLAIKVAFGKEQKHLLVFNSFSN